MPMPAGLPQPTAPTALAIDDETGYLNALKRLFR